LKSSKITGLKVISLIVAVSLLSFTAFTCLPGCKPASVTVEETESTGAILDTHDDIGPKDQTTEMTGEENIQTLEEADVISDNINMLSGLELSDKVQNCRPIAIMVHKNLQLCGSQRINDIFYLLIFFNDIFYSLLY